MRNPETTPPLEIDPTRARLSAGRLASLPARSGGLPPYRLVTLLLFALIPAILGCGKNSQTDASSGAEEKKPDANPVTVEVAHASVRPVESIISAPGTLAPAQG